MNCAAASNDVAFQVADEPDILERLESDLPPEVHAGRHAANKVREPACVVPRESDAAPVTLNRGVSCPLPAASTSDMDSSVARSTADLPPSSPPTNEIAAEATKLGLDPECLTALPREMALEIINEEKAQRNCKRTNEAASNRSDSSLVGTYGDDNTASESIGSGPEVGFPSLPDFLRDATGSVEGASRLDPSPRSDQGQDLPSLPVPPGMDPEVFRGLPRDIQWDIVRQHPDTSAARETPAPTCNTSPPTMLHHSNLGDGRDGNDHLLSVLDAALAISAAPLAGTSNRRPSRRTRQRALRRPRLLQSTMQQINLENERRSEEMMQFFEVSRSRAPDQ